MIKQMIVMRNDLNMRKGKMVAQGAHASIMFLRDAVMRDGELSDLELQWFENGMKKICARADTEQELLDIAQKAKQAGLTVHVITDAGHTEFAGVPTKTCLCIGPNKTDEIDKITGHLKLL